jgi:DNA-binding response OmpR family regulator
MANKKKILVVDDSKTALLMTTMALAKGPYEITTATDGEQGLERAQAERPDLIVLDVVMPKMDGFETCRRLREQEATRETPVIMLTTRGEGENVEAGYESGCTEYVTKPINTVEFLARVKSCLGD